jgi:hypothetical protein
MKPTPRPTDIHRALTNQCSHAAALARWQARRAPAQLAALRQLQSYAGETLAARRAHQLTQRDTGPELSTADAEPLILWTNEDAPQVLKFWRGRDFLRHRGYYCDEHEHDTIEAAAVILADFPGLIFEAVRHSDSDGLRVDLNSAEPIDYTEAGSDWNASEARADAAREAIRSADSTARRMAEDEREHNEQWQHEQDLEQARGELDQNRAAFRRLAAELRPLCKSALATAYPAAADAIRAQLAAILRDRRDILQTIAEHKTALA